MKAFQGKVAVLLKGVSPDSVGTVCVLFFSSSYFYRSTPGKLCG